MGVRPLLALQHGNPVTSRGVKGVSGLLSIEVGRGFFQVVAGASGFASSCLDLIPGHGSKIPLAAGHTTKPVCRNYCAHVPVKDFM